MKDGIAQGVLAPQTSIGPTRLSPWTKWLVLAATLVTEGVGYYILDIPGATHNQLGAHFQSQGVMPFEYFFNLMYSLSNVSSIIFPLFFGRVSDKFGDVVLYPVCTLLLSIGAAGVACGVQVHSETIMLVSRPIFGAGFSGIVLLNSVVISKWFAEEGLKPSHLAFAFALSTTSSRVSSAVNNLVSPQLGEHVSIQFAYWVGVILGVCGVLSGLLISFMETKRRLYEAQRQLDIESSNQPLAETRSLWQSVRTFPLLFWLILTLSGIFYGTLAAAQNVMQPYLIERLCDGVCCEPGEGTCSAETAAIEVASMMRTLPLIFCIVLGPLTGIGIDRLGYIGLSIVSSVSLVCVMFGLFTFSSVSPIAGLVFEGIAAAVFVSAAWPCVPLLINKSMLGVAFALMVSSYSLACTLFPIFVSAVRKSTYQSVQILFFVLSCCMLFLAIGLYTYDSKTKKLLR
mmetsp:Transcript_10196/g.16670  ORF Transcript_10196/g.16670 Transcript_10196/m.16670 type:complete len:457 (+) Transcript_10196:903-2273(+)